VSGSGISVATCKSAPRSRQITTPAPHHSVFLQAGCPSCHPTSSIKALKASQSTKWNLCVSVYELIYSFSGPMRALGCNAPLIRFLTLELYIMFACLYSMIPHLYSKLFPTYLLPYLSFLLRIDPLRFQAGCRKRRLPVNQVLVFLCLFCVVIHFFWLVNVCFCCVWFGFFHTKPKGLVLSTPSQKIGLGKRLQNDLFCVEWGIKPQLSQSVNSFLCML